MELKDYYKILNVTPLATPQQIKKSFRLLALKWHPDKNPGNIYAEAQFREVQEAHEILSDTKKREAYNYKRWYRRSLGKDFTSVLTTPENILWECNRLENYVSGINVFQVDYDALSHHIRKLLKDTNTGILKQYNNTSINQQVVYKILRCSLPLPRQYTEIITELLTGIAGKDREMNENIRQFKKQQKQKESWNKYKVFSVFLFTIIICWLIYILAG